jgi:hypothetical protein
MRNVLIIALLVVGSSLAVGAAAGGSSRIARNPVSAADWKIWMATEAGLVRLNHDQISPEYTKCAKLKRAAAIGICDAKPLTQQARGIGKYVVTIAQIARKLPRGQCRSAIARYELALQAAVSSAIVSNKELILTNKPLWKSALALEKQIKTVLNGERGNAKKLCKP